jgi:hypothetical protein
MFKPGDKKPANSGRKPGVVNKRAQQLTELAELHNADPFMFLVNVMKGNESEFIDKRGDVPNIKFETRMEAAKELMPYLHGKRKQVDSEGNDTNDLIADLINAINDK